MERIIGIDFGTSTTYMYVKRYNGEKPLGDSSTVQPIAFDFGAGNGMVASIVRENADGTFDFGEKAADQLDGAHVYREIKMRLESPDEEERAKARRITENFFKYLYDNYNQQKATLGDANDAETTIVSYPVKWQPETVEFMLEAARNAGFANVTGMDEATAAVFAMLNQNANTNANGKFISAGSSGYLMLVDMGAGTTDLVVCKYSAGETGGIQVKLVTSWPQTADEPTFGGREIDAVLEKYVEDYLSQALIENMRSNAHVLATTPGAAKAWKEKNVSDNLCAGNEVNTCAYLAPYRNAQMIKGAFPAFGREKFEEMTKSGLADYAKLLAGCLNDAAENDEDFARKGLDFIILTGGHSAWYFARDILDGTMEGYLDHPALARIREQKARVNRLPNPQSTVSLGLVYSRLLLVPDEPKPNPVPNPVPNPTPNPVPNPTPNPKPDGETYYKWYAQMETRLERYMRNHAGTVVLHLRNSHSADLRRRLNVPATDKVFLAHDDSMMKSGGSGFVVTNRGIYFKDSLSNPSPCLSWEDFMNGTLWPFDPKNGKFGLKSKSGGAYEFAMIFLTGSNEDSSVVREKADTFFRGLQNYLRQASIAVQERQELPDQPVEPDKPVKPEPPAPIEDDLFVPTIGGVPRMEYDPSKCPSCGTAIPAGKSKCPECKCRKLPEPPFEIAMVSWYKGRVRISFSVLSTGTFSVKNNQISFKKIFGNATANPAPMEIFWLKDIVALEESTYGLSIPSIVVTMRDGSVYTFVAASASVANKSKFKYAMAMLCSLWHKMHDNQ